jgi:queuine tRNA-ribosyltransferase
MRRRFTPSRIQEAARYAEAVTAFGFVVTHRDGAARRGELRTPHGTVQTPAFMPVGTRGAVKAITQQHLDELGAEIILANTYHLYLRPGDELIARCGGLHRFAGWSRPILTDSGGYQVFSLAAMRRIREEGAEFRSHLDGSRHLLTPERAADIQARLGSDIAMVLDECAPSPSGAEAARQAMQRSARWARRARARFLQIRDDPRSAPDVTATNPGQAQFGIIQGGVDPALRTESVQATVEIGFEAYAIGGLSVGEPVDVMYDVVAHTAPQLNGRDT